MQNELTPEQTQELLNTLKEISAAMARMEAERALLNAMKTDICEKTNIPKKVLNRLAKTYHKNNYTEEVTEHQHFEELYGTIIGEN